MYKLIITILILASMINLGYSQTKFGSKDKAQLIVEGTSTMHDWDMKASSGECTATFTLTPQGEITAFSSMFFSIASTALKSGKDLMDTKAHKALKAEKNPRITAELINGTVTRKDSKNATLKGKIKLTIAGKTLETDLQANAKMLTLTSYEITGEKKIDMKNFGMEPPSFMLVTVGKDVTLKFNLTLNKL
jgi:hypothetical protein